nr:hypothetical protein [Ignavibacteria bacterium]
MAKYIFDHDKLRLAISLAKIIKPESGDYCFSFSSNKLTIFSFDRRRYVCSSVLSENIGEIDTSFKSNEYYINASRLSLFDSDLTSIVISINDKSMSISCSGDFQKRNVNLKRKNSKSKRKQVPLIPSYESVSINSKDFEQLLTQVSCSALIKETKTIEEMRINQVHFYSGEDYACSSARYYGTAVYLPGVGLDLSIVAADIPAIKR